MEELINKILDWPIIVQSIVGSAIFWIIAYLGQILSKKLSIFFSRQSKTLKLTRSRNELAKYLSEDSKDYSQKNFFASITIFRSLRPFYKALIWLTLGLIFSSFIAVFGIIGYVGCLYYLFKASDTVGIIDLEIDIKKKIKELQKEVNSLQNKIKKT